MADIKDYVSVTVTRGSRPIDTAGFGIPMFLAQTNMYGAAEEFRIYSDTTTMIEDGWPTNHPAVKFATGAFSQTQKPNTILIGRQDYTAITGTPVVTNDTAYTISIGVASATQTVTFTSDATALAAEIVDGLIALIDDATVLGAVVLANVGDVLTVTPNAGVEAALTGDLTISATGLEDVDVSLAAVTNSSNNWFFLAGQSQVEADILKFAAFAQSNDKMYFTSVPVSTVGAAPTTDIASQLKTLQYDNTQTITREDANLDEYASGSLIGSMAATNPGTSIWFAKTLQGTTAENFSGTQEANIAVKNSNYYPLVASVGFYTDGTQASGEFGDTIRFSLWLKARIAEAVFGLMKRKSDLGLKIPHNDTGYAMVQQVIMNDVIQLGISRGAISTSEDGAPSPVVRVPTRSEVPTNDRAARILPDVVVDLVYSGAVQDVRNKVYVTV